MRKLVKNESMILFLCAVLMSSLLGMPMFLDFSMAQDLNSSSLIISHQPIKLGFRGKSMSIVANVSDEAGIKNVSLVVNYGGNSKTGSLPQMGGNVPVIVQIAKDTKIYSGPTSKYRVKGSLSRGEIVKVTKVKDGFYRILTDGAVYGYVNSIDTRIITSGKAYGVSIPATMTDQDFITYQIVATDATGNITKTKLQKVRLITDEELVAMRAQSGGGKTVSAASSEGASGSSMTKFVVLAGLVAVGAGAYYYINQSNQDDTADVEVLVEWE